MITWNANRSENPHVTCDVTSDKYQVLCKTSELPGPLFLRICLWIVIFAVFPLSVTTAWHSFRLEVLGHTISGAVLPCGNDGTETLAEPHDGILRYLESAEAKEVNRSYQADYRIAYLAVSWCARGIPESSYHRESPHCAATWAVLKCAPDDVWRNICLERKQQLGSAYSLFYDEAGNSKPDPALEQLLNRTPKKPVASERNVRWRKSA